MRRARSQLRGARVREQTKLVGDPAPVWFCYDWRMLPYGTETLMRDDSGNFYSLTQRR